MYANKISATIIALFCITNNTIFTMDNDIRNNDAYDVPSNTTDNAISEDQFIKSQCNKFHFIRDVLTRFSPPWDEKLSKSIILLCYRLATTQYPAPVQEPPSSFYMEFLKEFMEKNPTTVSKPTSSCTYDLYERDSLNTPQNAAPIVDTSYTYIGCSNGDMHIITQQHEKNLHTYIPNIHPAPITALAPITDRWIGIAGKSTITFFNTRTRNEIHRIDLNDGPLINLHYDEGVLIATHENNTQYKIYPYSAETASAIHKNSSKLSNPQIEVLFRAMLALYEKRTFECTTSECTKLFSMHPEIVTYVINRVEPKVTLDKNI